MSKAEKLPFVLSNEKFEARNWKEVSKRKLQSMPLIQRSRYLAYEKSPDIKGMKRCQSRLNEHARLIELIHKENQLSQNDLRVSQKREDINGQVKAYDAKCRVQNMSKFYRMNRASEICHLISMQPTAIKAVRLESLLPPIYKSIQLYDTVSKGQRMRIEALMEDELGIKTGRILC